MTWSLAIIDDGVTDKLQAQIGKPTAFAYDFYFDRGLANAHAKAMQ